MNIVGETGWSYATEMNYAITLPDNELYNDGSFEVKIGSSGTCPGCDDCWFRMLEIYGTPESLIQISYPLILQISYPSTKITFVCNNPILTHYIFGKRIYSI